MMRANTSAALQKCYDDCYLICSTAIYFEDQGNESEAHRSWRNALDQIYHFKANRVPTNWRPQPGSEQQCHQALNDLELRAKERIDLMEALKRSREDIAEKSSSTPGVSITPPFFSNGAENPSKSKESLGGASGGASGGSGTWLGDGTIPPMTYSDLARPPALPTRPAMPMQKSSSNTLRPHSEEQSRGQDTPMLTPVVSRNSDDRGRTPSPEKKSGFMLKTLRPHAKERSSSSRSNAVYKNRPPAAAKAATQAWGSISKASAAAALASAEAGRQTPAVYSAAPESSKSTSDSRSSLGMQGARLKKSAAKPQPPSPPHIEDLNLGSDPDRVDLSPSAKAPNTDTPPATNGESRTKDDVWKRRRPPPVPPHKNYEKAAQSSSTNSNSPLRLPSTRLTYRNEYPPTPFNVKQQASIAASRPYSSNQGSSRYSPAPSHRTRTDTPQQTNLIHRKAVNGSSYRMSNQGPDASSDSGGDTPSSNNESESRRRRRKLNATEDLLIADVPSSPISEASQASVSPADREWQERVDKLMNKLPKGVDEAAAKQILNDIVIQGDEVHWSDVAGLEIAKSALKETVVYPFLRPDLFMGLREPARGMLLFGPPGTGKTMLARAVATESKSTFFAISASSLTSKYLGESEKLVKALFSIARALAPSIIFVDEIDSLLSSRGGGSEHEATRRIKTEFLIQWSDLQKAAAGRETSEREKEKGDASRVLVLAATNLPWAIDEAARRRFVRRQYIPLPEAVVRKGQLRTLMGFQQHSLTEEDLEHLVGLTEGFSGSDITALAKDAAMGPLRSLGEDLLHMSMDQIRPISVQDFEKSLESIRPSVSKQGLKEFEEWAREFGERGG
ncbi:AAA-domain-containing protein [Aulographum hederae CBS 113979]|uniref:AAA-domain-containing protein n=1 Tax=Aulographum hederae CBS 113979 TaxID=1176131 RepID=A0A6G1GTN7_9PEZI|nr:AAA-domain-containing protein [Aulographum hederae CBS 113979]